MLTGCCSANWLAISHGCASQSMPIVTAYDTLGQSGLTHSLVQTEAKAIFLDPHLLTQLITPLKEAIEVRAIIYNTESPVKQEDIDKLKSAHERLRIISIDDLVKLGEENPIDPNPAGPEDLCGIMYTSGSTGTPKGVPLLHKNVIAAGKCPTSLPVTNRINASEYSYRCNGDRRSLYRPW